MDVVLTNSRGPESLADKVAELGERARAGTPAEAAGAGDWVVAAIPLAQHRNLPAAALAGKVVVDTMNYGPTRDGRIDVLDAERFTESEMVQEHLAGAKLVKAFNDINVGQTVPLARPAGHADRSAPPLAGNDAEAKASAAALIDQLGYDTVDVGTLGDSWRFEPETAPFVMPYLADPEALIAYVANLAKPGVPPQSPPEDPGTPLPAHRLRTLLAEAHRVRVADRIM
ncbi:NADPH-dependent F420 reductase [Streptomyces sp. NPDC001530]|uniref:NADPH-dependent F420 reductase n=1 Tax=Streptomyces sp. NPDC001530 TaxID=3364582 RepID=UPI0036C22B3A